MSLLCFEECCDLLRFGILFSWLASNRPVTCASLLKHLIMLQQVFEASSIPSLVLRHCLHNVTELDGFPLIAQSSLQERGA